MLEREATNLNVGVIPSCSDNKKTLSNPWVTTGAGQGECQTSMAPLFLSVRQRLEKTFAGRNANENLTDFISKKFERV